MFPWFADLQLTFQLARVLTRVDEFPQVPSRIAELLAAGRDIADMQQFFSSTRQPLEWTVKQVRTASTACLAQRASVAFSLWCGDLLAAPSPLQLHVQNPGTSAFLGGPDLVAVHAVLFCAWQALIAAHKREVMEVRRTLYFCDGPGNRNSSSNRNIGGMLRVS